MLVANDVSSDSRVQKVALAASEAGYRVTVVGRAKKGGRWVEALGDARVVRVPVSFERLEAAREAENDTAAISRRPRVTSRATSRVKQEEVRVARIDERLRTDSAGGRGAHAAGLGVQLRARQALIKALQGALVLGRAVARWRSREPDADVVDEALESRKHRALVSDYEHTYLAEIGEMNFDLVHAHDSTMIACATQAVLRAASLRARPRVVYDAHEYPRGLSNLPSYIRDVHVSLEDQCIKMADAVVTVSPILADRLQHDHALPSVPSLVLNTPLAAAFSSESPLSVRASAALGDEVPLAVYAGVVKPLRGVHTVVRAMPLLPDLHVAVVVSTPHAPVVKDLAAEATRAGCSDRLHILPYVEQDQVINYIRTADVGLYPLLRSGNTELAWPTKIFEYLHAGLPMVVSDMPSMSQLVTEQGWGEVFAADDHVSFAAAMQRVLAQPRAYNAALHDEAVRARFSWEHQARTLIDTYDRLLLDPSPERSRLA